MTVGDLTAAHLGQPVTFTVATLTQDRDGVVVAGEHTVSGSVLIRIQHNPGETLISSGAWSGPLDPAHPVTIETGA